MSSFIGNFLKKVVKQTKKPLRPTEKTSPNYVDHLKVAMSSVVSMVVFGTSEIEFCSVKEIEILCEVTEN